MDSRIWIFASLISCIFAKRGFIMTAPKAVNPGQIEKVCFTFFEVESEVQVTLSLKVVDKDEKAALNLYRFPNGEGKCVDFTIPVSLKPEKWQFDVEGEAPDENYEFEGKSKPVKILEMGTFIFIQTDKPQYKPGQTVQFRVLSLDPQLKPVLGNVHAVWVEDPSGVRMTQWLDVTTVKGLVSFDMPLSEDPVLGDWKISMQVQEGGKTESKSFKVDEYVLPKYEITIKPPSYVPINANEIEGEVCAKYTYGKPVKGDVEIKVCITNTYRAYERPCQTIIAEIDGCYKFVADPEVLSLKSAAYNIWGAKVKFDATVTEKATGVNLTESDESAKVERHIFRLEFKPHTPTYFKPGLPFHGKLRVIAADGQPLAGQLIKLSASKYGTDFKFEESIRSNGAGEILFTIPQVNQDISSFTLEARAEGYDFSHRSNIYQPYEPTGYHYLKQWYSPSGSFVQIERSEESLPCDEEREFLISYTTEANTRFKFHYEIMARGNIVEKGHKSHHFKNHDSLPIDGGAPEVPIRVNLQGTGRRGPKTGDDGEEKEEAARLPHVASFPLKLRISHEMSPVAHLLVYYVRQDGEVVADSVQFNVHSCLINQVSLNFDPSKVYPGGDSTLRLEATPESLCSVGVVDKSVHLLGGNNQVSRAKIFAVLAGQDLNEDSHNVYHSGEDYCDKKLREEEEGRRGGKGKGRNKNRRNKRSSMPWYPGGGYSDYYDSLQAFKAQASVVVSDLEVETRPCEFRRYQVYHSPVGMPGMPGLGGDSVARGPPGAFAPGPMPDAAIPESPEAGASSPEEEDQQVDIRTYFPETWLWDLYDVGESGEVEITQEVPHTITDWIGSAFCTNLDAGFGVSDSTTLRAFQPFFVSFTLPYSIIRGERVIIPVTVFNYLSECSVIDIEMESTEQLQVVGSREPQRLCVCGNEAGTANFLVEATDMGMVNLTAKAVSVQNHDYVCENRLVTSMDVVRDAATRQILVEPEGIEEEYTYSKFVCPKDGEEEMLDVQLYLPDVGLIEGSERATISIIGDVMGPTLSNLDSLVRLPTGCGEQNMLKFAPNIFVMQYLRASNQLSRELETKALGYMKTGYQRELTYRHQDGSYSAFGESDDSGSTWLTAFVVRSFAQAREFIYIDQKDLDRSVEWFRSNQKPNGCFRSVGRLCHKSMKGGLTSSDSDTGLTAYVLLALMEAGIKQDDEMIRQGIDCLRSQTSATEDMYTASLVTYVYSMLDTSYASLKAEMKDKMDNMATTEDGMMHWSKSESPPTPPKNGWYHMPKSADIEMTSYALMAYLHMAGRDQAITTGLPIVKWLSSQRNAFGGFSSTQDTVVGLQALADYASMVYSEGADLAVSVSDQNGNGFPTFSVTDENSLVLQQHPIDVPNHVYFGVQGSGCTLVQANVKYNVDPDAGEETESFKLRVAVEETHDEFPSDHCDKRRISICAKFNSQEPSNMAVVEVKMQTGWIPDKLSLMALKKDQSVNLKRYEVDKNMVNLYFDEFVDTYTCMKFLVIEDMKVENAKEAHVHIYDYYETELAMTHNYKIKRTCGTKMELPVLTPDEYEDQVDKGFQGQLRVPDELPFIPDEPTVCPQCLDAPPEDFAEKMCAGSNVYKGITKRGKVRILTDLKQPRSSVIDGVVYVNQDNLGFSLDACECEILEKDMAADKNLNNRVIIITKGTSLESEKVGRRTEHSLELDDEAIVFPLVSDREVKRAVRRCGRK